jgi:hypothetical protein
MSGVRQVNDETKKIAFEKMAQIKIYNLHILAQVIDLACKRGAFSASEASQVGALFDILAVGVNKAFDLAEDEIKKVDKIKSSNIAEDIV